MTPLDESPTPALLFDLDGTLVDSVYQDPGDLLEHLDELGVRSGE